MKRAARKNGTKGRRIWLLGVLGLLIIATVLIVRFAPKQWQQQVAQTQQTAITHTPAKPAPSDFAAVAAAARPSIVKIENEVCGYIVTGSGFIVGPGLIATNAHVVGGVPHPQVYTEHGSFTGTTVAFDPDLDVAVIRVSELAGKALPLDVPTADTNIDIQGSHNNQPVVMLGFPGGVYATTAATITAEYRAQMYDIYDKVVGDTRNLFSLNQSIEHGNSGGPLLEADGRVIGIVFGTDPGVQHKGLALPTIDFAGLILQSKNRTSPADTQTCAIARP